MSTVHFWATREQALSVLDGEMAEARRILERFFLVLTESVNRHNLRRNKQKESFLYGLLIAKARRLLLASYSLILDGIGQETGALLRPTIECLELLVYFNQDPSRIEEALENRFPKAGIIAQRIDSGLRGLRGYLNKHASHIKLEGVSIQHLVTGNELRSAAEPVFGQDQFNKNIQMLCMFLQMTAHQSVVSLQTVDAACADDLAGHIQRETDKMRCLWRLEELRTQNRDKQT